MSTYEIVIHDVTATVNGKTFDYWPTMAPDGMAERIASDYLESLPGAEVPCDYDSSELSTLRELVEERILAKVPR